MIFVGIDGDRIGARLEGLIITGAVGEAADFSRRVDLAVRGTAQLLESWGGRVLFAGGDSVLAEMESAVSEKQWKELTQLFQDATGCTASAGTGSSPVEAYLALKLAKVTQSGRVLHYQDCVP